MPKRGDEAAIESSLCELFIRGTLKTGFFFQLQLQAQAHHIKRFSLPPERFPGNQKPPERRTNEKPLYFCSPQFVGQFGLRDEPADLLIPRSATLEREEPNSTRDDGIGTEPHLSNIEQATAFVESSQAEIGNEVTSQATLCQSRSRPPISRSTGRSPRNNYIRFQEE